MLLKDSACVAAYKIHVREQVVILCNVNIDADNVYLIKQTEEHLCSFSRSVKLRFPATNFYLVWEMHQLPRLSATVQQSTSTQVLNSYTEAAKSFLPM